MVFDPKSTQGFDKQPNSKGGKQKNNIPTIVKGEEGCKIF